MSTLIFAAQSIAAYGFNKGLDKIFSNSEDFSNRLFKIISLTIDEYQNKYPVQDQDKQFAFYKSQVLIEELLKFRLYSNKGYKLSSKKIEVALESNPNIIRPNEAELENFIRIFDNYINQDKKLKLLEIEAFHKEAIFDIYNVVKKALNILETHLVESASLLENQYQAELNNYLVEIKSLKPQTALKHLQDLEKRVNENIKHVSKKVQATLKYLIGICNEALGSTNSGYENFILAYNLEPEKKVYIEKACISYYFLKDHKYRLLQNNIDEFNDYNTFSWAINTIESENIVDYIQETVPQNVLDKSHYKRIIFNNNLKANKVNPLELIDLLDVTKDLKSFPSSINYDNFHHWIFILNAFSMQFFSSCEIPYWRELEKNEISIRFLELSRVISQALEDSELYETYNVIIFYYYWLESELEIQNDTLSNLKAAYNSLKERDALSTMLLANSIQKHDSIENALKYIDEFQGDMDEGLVALRAFCHLGNSQTEEKVTEYFKFVKCINELNAINACGYLIPTIKSNVIEKDSLAKILNNIEFTKQAIKHLMFLMLDSLYPKKLSIEIGRINKLRDTLVGESKLYFFIALLYFENKYFAECISFQESYIDETKESRDLFLFIRALDASKNQKQLKLLRLLKQWRTSFTYNDYLIRIELELQQILKDWKEIEEITEYALKESENDEVFYTFYLIALGTNNKQGVLKKEIKKIKEFKFKSTENAITVTSILLHYNFTETALELLYCKALNKADSLARMNYITLPGKLLKEYFKEYEVVSYDCFVKFEINDEIETIHINEDTSLYDIIQKAMGKTVLEKFSIEKSLSKKIKTVKILRIMNKYLALYDEIYAEAQSSFSNLPMESVRFDSTNLETFEKVLIENFGPAEEEIRKHTEESFRKYQNYDLSFNELSNANFRGSFIDAYYQLTSNQSEGFLVKPMKYFDDIEFNNKTLIIDFSSGLLFFELEAKMGIRFHKFVVTENVFILIDKLIAETESQRNSKMSVSVYNKKIVPHFYPEDFHDKRIDFLSKLKKWFQENSISENPEEKLEIMRPLYAESKVTNAMEYIVDNAFLSQRKNYLLITDDFGYEKLLKINNWSTTELYLRHAFPDKKNEILEVMLSFRYVGLTVNSDILYSTYINHFKEGYNYIFNYALRNLSLPENFKSSNIFIVVDFLKKLALNPVLTKEKYKYDATNILTMVISNFPNRSFNLLLKESIEQQFNLLGHYYDLTISALQSALEIKNFN